MLAATVFSALLVFGQGVSDPIEIQKELRGLRSVPDAVRGEKTRQIALQIRTLPAGDNKIGLADGLANLATEGDYGHAALQEVATTLAEALEESKDSADAAAAYAELAQLVRYEHLHVRLQSSGYRKAVQQLDETERARHLATFTLSDLDGRPWNLAQLKGKVVLVNFWATWCPPCRKEMPDLDRLYFQFKDKGFIVLAISDETPDKVKSYIAAHPVSYPILLDPGRKVNTAYKMEGIPNSYIYNREGKLVAEAEDMRTRNQFLHLLGEAGLH